MAFRFIKSIKGKDILIDEDNYSYNLQATSATGTRYWRCTKYSSSKCRGSANTLDDLIRVKQGHNHVETSINVRYRELRHSINESSKDFQGTTSNIIANALFQEPSMAVQSNLPKIESLKSQIRKKRKREDHVPPTPNQIDNFIVPLELTLTATGCRFLYADIVLPRNKRMMIFTTRGNLDFMCGTHIHADGTFKVVPSIFYQLYVLIAFKNNFSVPVVYCLLPNKEKSTYERLWTELKLMEPNLNPMSLMTDFETGAINAFSSHFPEVRTRGCFFHYSQSIWRKIQKNEEILLRYKADPDFTKNIKKLVALAFVPANYVVSRYEVLCQAPFFVENQDLLTPLLEYYEKTWIGSVRVAGRRRRRLEPLFPHSLWSVYEDVKKDLPRTNNISEGYNYSIRNFMRGTHIPIWSFIQFLQKQQCIQDLRIQKINDGDCPSAKRKQYAACDKRIKICVLRFRDLLLDNYLGSLANNFDMSREVNPPVPADD